MVRTVVVGVEGSASSHDALTWAATAAQARRCRLLIVHAWGHPISGYEITFDSAIEQHGKDLLEAAAARAQEGWPGLEVRTELDRDTPARALTRRSRDSDLVVVGSHPMGRVERVVVGSLSYQVVAGSHSPVAVVPSLPGPEARGVVVGVDGSPDGAAAVALAAAEADRLTTGLTAVHAWQEPGAYISAEYLSDGLTDSIREGEAVVLGESVAGIGETYPDLPVEQRLVQGGPAEVLLDAARGSRLLVIGSRGRHGVVRMLLGSVSHDVVLRAPCPVLVARS